MTSDAALSVSRLSANPLILETPNPLDLSLDDLRDLSAEIANTLVEHGAGGIPVSVSGDEPLGAGNEFTEILNIILPNAEFIKETAFAAVIASATTFMRARFKRKHEGTRPRQINVHTPEGK